MFVKEAKSEMGSGGKRRDGGKRGCCSVRVRSNTPSLLCCVSIHWGKLISCCLEKWISLFFRSFYYFSTEYISSFFYCWLFLLFRTLAASWNYWSLSFTSFLIHFCCCCCCLCSWCTNCRCNFDSIRLHQATYPVFLPFSMKVLSAAV